MSTVLVTGYPGFLGAQLLPRIVARDADVQAVCLVQERWRPLAEERLTQLEAETPGVRGRIRLVNGDITQEGLGLPAAERAEIVRGLTEIYHLAAVYDLSVPREFGWKVNVVGTRNVVSLAAEAPRFERLQYVSTCYVSGRYTGIFRETDLQLGQSFNNFYEETKHHAEVVVQEAMRGGLPATVYRPSVVVGDSTTGATQKFDGPYYIVQLLLRQPRIAVMPTIGDPAAYRFNMVPRDYIIDAITALSAETTTVGKVFNLADPAPLTVGGLLDTFAAAAGRTVVKVPTTRGLAKFAIDHVPGVAKLMRVPSSAVDYFTHPTHYDTALTAPVLAKLGVECPAVPDYADTMVEFMRQHPEISPAAMV